MTGTALRRRALRKPYVPYNNAGVTPYLSDSFNRADSTSTAGSTDSYAGASLGNGAWTVIGGATFGIAGGALYAPGGVSEGHLISPAISSAVEVRATLTALASGAGTSVGLIGGYTDANNFVLAYCRGDGLMSLYRRTGGSYTQIATAASGTLQAGDEVTLRLEPSQDGNASGTLVTVLRNGVIARSSGAASLQAVILTSTMAMGTKVGIREDSNNTTWRIKNLRAYPIIAAPSMAKTYPAAFTPGVGEGTDVLNPDVKYLNGQWVMNYSTNDGDTRLAYCAGTATTPPLGPWTREANNPILTPSVGEGWAFNGSIVALGGTYYLYYSTNNGPSGNPATSIATATALSGPWTKQGVLTLSGRSTTSDQYAETISGTTIRLWFRDGGAFYYATSTDGLTFGTPVLAFDTHIWAPWSTNGECAVFTDAAGALHLFWAGGGAGSDNYRSIHEAVSYDGGTTWPVIRPYRIPKGGGSTFDNLQTFDAAPVLINGTVYCFYAGCQVSGNALGLSGQIGLAIGPNY